jgi:hypothetical protein
MADVCITSKYMIWSTEHVCNTHTPIGNLRLDALALSSSNRLKTTINVASVKRKIQQHYMMR